MATLEGKYVEETELPDGDTFEIGLVMAGAISAGAYEAGVLDYLFEALDAWEAAKLKARGTAEEQHIPQHKVIIKVVAAASAGSMSAAIMAVAGRYDFKHVGSAELGTQCHSQQNLAQRTQAYNSGRENPFFRAWVQDISMDKLLTTRDLDAPDSVLQSLLDSTSLMEITNDCLAFKGDGVVHRQYLSNPTRFIFALANLRGVPYFLPFSSQPGTGLGMSMHRDYRSFTVSYSLGAGAQTLRADDLALDWSPQSAAQWSLLGLTAVSSGAFPVGLAPRPMTRPSSDYNYRFVILPATHTDPIRAVRLQPNTKRMPEPLFNSFIVDGGTMNNEPVDLAHQELAGLIGRNTRDGVLARRALLMIDPFPDTEEQGSDKIAGQSPVLTSVIGDLLQAWKYQARFKPEDLALAADENVFSRFLIAPSRGDLDPTKPSLACGALGGFSGFLTQDFRQHDYLLGRRNAQKFLSDVFTLPVANSMFDPLDETQKVAGTKWVRKGARGLELPIIPLVDSLLPKDLSGGLTDGRTEALGDWPYDMFRMSSIESAMKARMNRIFSYSIAHSELSWSYRLLSKTAVVVFKGKIYKKVTNALLDGLANGGLMPKRPDATDQGKQRNWFG
ncbi:patatin [Pseudomonas sp. Fl5BN2]|uniref:patatin n=1 Tax=Pseudomonas sp. Fl5BN2 TaxID=2697652 RepID=UPI001376E30B|nr:patatin [Pseudomonas sp. Fl5BN2]NBF05967.1 patatin [Pseudomonas sp. Fl5BN2]